MQKFKNVPTLSGLVSFSPTAAHGVRPCVPGDPRAEQHARGRRDHQGQGRPEDLGLGGRAARRRRGGPEHRSGPPPSRAAFEGVQALRDVTLELHRHEVVGLIGPNGAGQVDARQRPHRLRLPDEGRVELEGRDVTRWRPHRRGRAGLARTFQHSRSFRGLTVRENVEVAALGVGAGPREARAARRRAARARSASTAMRDAPAGRSRTATSADSASHGPSPPSRASS